MAVYRLFLTQPPRKSAISQPSEEFSTSPRKKTIHILPFLCKTGLRRRPQGPRSVQKAHSKPPGRWGGIASAFESRKEAKRGRKKSQKRHQNHRFLAARPLHLRGPKQTARRHIMGAVLWTGFAFSFHPCPSTEYNYCWKPHVWTVDNELGMQAVSANH